MSLSMILQQCLACLVRLTLIVFVMGDGGRTAAALWGVVSGTCSKLPEHSGVVAVKHFFHPFCQRPCSASI